MVNGLLVFVILRYMTIVQCSKKLVNQSYKLRFMNTNSNDVYINVCLFV